MKDYQERPIFESLRHLFFDSSNREKRTPLFESVIHRQLEEHYKKSEISYALKKFQDEKIFGQKRLFMKKESIEKVGKVKFYYPASLEIDRKQKTRLDEKIEKISGIIKRYSNNKNTAMLGKHLHYLVKTELRVQGFDIEDENTNKYEEKRGGDNQHFGKVTLDIIAKHKIKNIKIGVEVKNSLDLIPKKELQIKIKMCHSLKIIPVFACRWLKPFHNTITSSGGFPWEFKTQIYPLGQERLAKILKNRLGLPVEVLPELPFHAIKDFEKWMQKFE